MAAPFRPARRCGAVLTPVIPWLNGQVAAHPGTLSLAQGMVNWEPPESVRALAAGGAPPAADLHRYGAMAGDADLLAAIEAELTGVRGLNLDGSALLVTAGSNMAFASLCQVILDPGDEVILPLPYYFNHVMAVQLAGGVPVTPDLGSRPEAGALEALVGPRTRAIVTVSPGNPSGVVQPPAQLAAINRLCGERGLLHISDEAYADFVFGAVPHHSPGRASGSAGHTVSLFSLSKAYGMAGWRVGYAAVPRQLLAALAKVQDTVLICPPRRCQRAAVAALAAGPAWCRPRIAALAERRQLLLSAVAARRAAGLELELLAEPDGAFYALLAFPCPLGGTALMERLVRDHGVAAISGESFGVALPPGHGSLRLSYGMLPPPLLAEALERLFQALAELVATARNSV
ncbi:MAG: aminotransferase class I/II-fold pyridoxal phosphate-dependent enzyme [Prochlorococcaceae cyanobacterium]